MQLRRAHLYSADIKGADFIQCRPWEALLYFSPGQKEFIPVPFHTARVEDINGLLDACRELKSGYGGLPRCISAVKEDARGICVLPS